MTIQYAIVMLTLEMWSIELTWETKQNQSHCDITQCRGKCWLHASCPLISPLISASVGMGSSIQLPAASDSPKAFIPLSHSLLSAKTVFQHCPVYLTYCNTAQNCWVHGFSSHSYWKSMMSPVLGQMTRDLGRWGVGTSVYSPKGSSRINWRLYKATVWTIDLDAGICSVPTLCLYGSPASSVLILALHFF